MADMMETLRGILGEGADEKIQEAMNILSSSGQQAKKKESLAEEIERDIHIEKPGTNINKPSLTPENMEFLSQIRGMVDTMSNTNDKRSDLLRSLKPFMRSSRQQTIDKAIKIMNIGRFSGLFGKL